MRFQNNLSLWKQYNPNEPVQKFFKPETSEFDCAVNLALGLLLGESTSNHLKSINRFTTPQYKGTHDGMWCDWVIDIPKLEMQTILQIQLGEMARLQYQWERRFLIKGTAPQEPLIHFLTVALDSVALEALAFLILGNDMIPTWYLYRDRLCRFVGSNNLNCGSLLRKIKDRVLLTDWNEVTNLPLFKLAKDKIDAHWLI